MRVRQYLWLVWMGIVAFGFAACGSGGGSSSGSSNDDGTTGSTDSNILQITGTFAVVSGESAIERKYRVVSNALITLEGSSGVLALSATTDTEGQFAISIDRNVISLPLFLRASADNTDYVTVIAEDPGGGAIVANINDVTTRMETEWNAQGASGSFRESIAVPEDLFGYNESGTILNVPPSVFVSEDMSSDNSLGRLLLRTAEVGEISFLEANPSELSWWSDSTFVNAFASVLRAAGDSTEAIQRLSAQEGSERLPSILTDMVNATTESEVNASVNEIVSLSFATHLTTTTTATSVTTTTSSVPDSTNEVSTTTVTTSSTTSTTSTTTTSSSTTTTSTSTTSTSTTTTTTTTLAVGQASYNSLCASCHGTNGEGGGGSSLQGCGTCTSQSVLSARISDTMPRGNPNACTGTCADDVATYILATFN